MCRYGERGVPAEGVRGEGDAGNAVAGGPRRHRAGGDQGRGEQGERDLLPLHAGQNDRHVQRLVPRDAERLHTIHVRQGLTLPATQFIYGGDTIDKNLLTLRRCRSTVSNEPQIVRCVIYEAVAEFLGSISGRTRYADPMLG